MLFKTTKPESSKLNSLDSKIGKIADFYFDDQQWRIRYLVAGMGTGLTGRKVLISPRALGEDFKKRHLIASALTNKQIEDSRSLDGGKSGSHHCKVDYSQYYGCPHYWGGSGCWGNYPAMIGGTIHTNSDNEVHEETAATHLRSINEVATYRIHATDGEIGRVEDFIIDDKTWEILYLIVNTRNQRSGKKVLISPSKIERVSWADSEVFVNLTREHIRSAPEYTEKASLNRDYDLSRY
jgi:sporulation protein YlmC with PRC-barrel domain